MHQGGIGQQGFLWVNHTGQLFIVDIDQFCRIFRKGASVGHNGYNPFSSIARDIKGQWVACYLRCINPGQHGINVLTQFFARQDRMYPRCGQSFGGIDVFYFGASVG